MHTVGLGYPGLSWLYCISTNKSFSSSKTSSRTPYSNNKQQEKQKYSAENTINFSLRTDASDYAIGAVLEQVLDDGRHVPVAFWSRVLAEGQRRTWTPREKEAYAIVMALRKWAGYIALYPVTVCTDHQSLQSWHKEHVDTPSGPASRRARWHETLAKFDLTVVYIPGKDNTVADCLSRWAYPASKGMTDISAHGDEAETAEAKRIIEMERLMEEEGAKCFVVMAADAPLSTRVRRAVRVLAPEGAESDKHLFPESCLQDDWTDDYAKSEAFAAEYRAVTDPDDGQKWPKGLTEEDGKLYRNGKLLVPESRVLELCEAWHHHMLHPGVKKQALDMQRRFEIDHIVLYTAIKKVRKGCSVCQACNPDNRNVKGEAQWTPVPDQPMESVAMDVFSMPEVHIGKETFDCVVLCVDRHSGYVVAVPARKKGLLAREVAVMMIRHWLTVLTSPTPFAVTEGPSLLVAGSRQCVPSWEYVMPRASPISAGLTAALKWLDGSCSRSCARSTSPIHVGTGLRRCGLL